MLFFYEPVSFCATPRFDSCLHRCKQNWEWSDVCSTKKLKLQFCSGWSLSNTGVLRYHFCKKDTTVASDKQDSLFMDRSTGTAWALRTWHLEHFRYYFHLLSPQTNWTDFPCRQWECCPLLCPFISTSFLTQSLILILRLL